MKKKYGLPWDGLEFKWELPLSLTARLKSDQEKADEGQTTVLLLHLDLKLPEDRASFYHGAVNNEYKWFMVISRAVFMSNGIKEQTEEYLIPSWKLFCLCDRAGLRFIFLEYSFLLEYN